ncbi:MAG: ABC transporter substrate-binding protein [Thermodesulfobacteriota bacterium]
MMRRDVLGAAVFVFALMLCSGLAKGEIGVTDTEIKIGTHLALTGPAALVGVPIRDGHKICLEHFNALGGIHGRKIVYIAEDDQFMPSRAKEAVKKLIHSDKVFAIVHPLQGAGILAAEPDIMENKIPVLFVGTSLDALFKPVKRYIFGWTIPYYDSAAIQVDFAVKALGKKKIAFINQWGPVGEVNEKGAVDRTKKYGVELTASELLQNVEMDYSGLVSKLRAKGTEVVVITTTAQWTIPILKEIERQGWKPDVIVGHASGDTELLRKMGGSAADGIYVTLTNLPTDADDPFMNEYRAAVKKYGGGVEPSFYNFVGYANLHNFCTVAKEVGRDLTREKLIDTLEQKWKNRETWAGKITYAPDDHAGQEGLIISRMKDGKVEIIKKWAYPEP